MAGYNDVFRNIDRAINGDQMIGASGSTKRNSQEPGFIPMLVSSLLGATGITPKKKPEAPKEDTGDPGPDGANLDPSTRSSAADKALGVIDQKMTGTAERPTKKQGKGILSVVGSILGI